MAKGVFFVAASGQIRFCLPDHAAGAVASLCPAHPANVGAWLAELIAELEPITATLVATGSQ
jgi:hypothetical protein